jgi:branched-chain amino acid transport system substrate-binding protein
MTKRIWITLSIACLILLNACAGKKEAYTCEDALGCITIQPNDPIKLGALLTLTGPDSTTGIDSMRAIEIAISHKVGLLGHSVEVVKGDDLCEEEAGRQAASQLATDTDIIGVIGASCSSACVPAAKILSDAGTVLISPSSTLAALTDPATHQAGFLRTIYNNKAQADIMATFAREILGIQTMATLHDGSPFPKELQQLACDVFSELGGDCVAQDQVSEDENEITATIQQISDLKPEAIYYPLYTEAGSIVTLKVREKDLEDIELLSSDGLLNAEFIRRTGQASEGVYISGPSLKQVDPAFLQEYQNRYGEAPIDIFTAQSYDAVMMLFAAVEKVAGQDANGIIYIPRQGLRDALYVTKDMPGLSGVLTCSETGDCAESEFQIYQIQNGKFVPVYP